jgi:hypothetical protein
MVSGFWYNNDGLPLQFGQQKALPELGGDFLMYGESREFETYISLAATTWGSSNQLTIPALPSSFVGTGFPIAAGIQSMTNLFPLQITAPVTTASGGLGLVITATQLWIDSVELEVLVTANAGTGGATGLTGIGLVTTQPFNPVTFAPAQFVQVTPNAGVQLAGSFTNAAMTAGATYTFRPNANNAAGTGGAGYIQYSTANTATATAPAWIGNVPLVTNAITPLPTNAWVSAIAAGGTYTGTTAAGLLKLRVKYTLYGNISY